MLRRFLIFLLWAAGVVACAEPEPPRLFIDESVDADFTAVIEETWQEFLTVFAARTDCFGAVTVRADYDIEDRAVYDPETAVVSVRVPERKGFLQGALVHEWAHHIEFQCPEQAELRAPFLAAQGLPPDTIWRSGGSVHLAAGEWAQIPSEQYAEATVALVLGIRPFATNARINPESIAVVRTWAEGKRP